MAETELLEVPVETEGLAEDTSEDVLETEQHADALETEELAEGAEAVHEQEPGTPEELLENWLSLVDANPKSISSVPAQERPRVIEELRARDKQAFEATAVQIWQQAIDFGRKQAQAEVWVGQMDELLDEDSPRYDPGSFARWRKEKPEEFRTYSALKASISTAQPDQALDSRIGSVWQELAQHPAAQQAVVNALKASPLAKTADGVAQLERLAYREIGKAEARGKAPAAAPRTTERMKAAEQMRRLPKAPSSTGVAPGAEPSVQAALAKGLTAGQDAFERTYGFRL